MVDFQSRDTRRDDEEEEATSTDGEDEGGGSPAADDEGDGHTEADHDHGHGADRLGAAVLTVSSTRSLDDDPAGDAVAAAFDADDGEVVTRELVADGYDRVQGALNNLVNRGDVDVVVTTGGTGVSPDDQTVEAAEALFDKELPGFGELFRLLSHDDVGTRVVGTRATAGIVNRTPVFCLPGSEHAARLGSERIVVEEADHLAALARGDDHQH